MSNNGFNSNPSQPPPPPTQSITINPTTQSSHATTSSSSATAGIGAAGSSATLSSSSSNLLLPPPPPPTSTSSSSSNSATASTSTITLPLSSSLPSLINTLNSQTISINALNSTNPISITLNSSILGGVGTHNPHSSAHNEKMDTSCSTNSSSSSTNGCSSTNDLNNGTAIFVGDVISRLYPNVNQQETPLPRQWSTIHKCQNLNLTNGNLRVTYKGPGKNHKDAASVRTDYPIPAACGIYYYEIKIVSKGRDGYMGIGLSKSDVLLNRLPGWDKNSYGYHGDDGHSFCCSGTGQNYGPTFTTGDVIGCCLNLIENTCFYTKNGYNLGIAFRDLPSDLYPTIGLQTPLESVEANFGGYPFEFDIHNYVKEWHLKTRNTIERFQLKKDTEINLPTILRKLISTYLVHHGYSSTAEAFAKSVGHVFEEELASIRNRQRIQRSVLNGNLEEAIELTYQLFPGILERNKNLLFALKVRQFIEMINNANSTNNNSTIEDITTDNQENAEFSSSLNTQNTNISNNINNNNNSNNCNTKILADGSFVLNKIDKKNGFNCENNGYKNSDSTNEEAMELDSSPTHTTSLTNKTPNFSKQSDPNISLTNQSKTTKANNLLNYNDTCLQKILQFGRELFQINSQFASECGENAANTKMLRDAFSLLAYHDPWTSPIGFQLDASQREPISAMLNSAILESNNMPRIPPLEVVYGQTNECMRLMSKYGIAWCAYVNLADYMQS